MKKNNLPTIIRLLLLAAIGMLLGASQGISQQGPQTGPYRKHQEQSQMGKTKRADREKAAARNADRRAEDLRKHPEKVKK